MMKVFCFENHNSKYTGFVKKLDCIQKSTFSPTATSAHTVKKSILVDVNAF